MVYYPRQGGGPRYQMNSQRVGPTVPRRRQEENYYPNQMRRQDEAYFYPNEMLSRREEDYYYPNQPRRQDEAYYYATQGRRPNDNHYYPQQMRGQNYPPNQRPRSRFERLPDQLNSIAGHMGTINQGINIMRQVGSLLSMFRRT